MLETGSGAKPRTNVCCSVLPGCNAPLQFRRKSKGEREESVGRLQREPVLGLGLEDSYLFSKGGNFRGGLRGGSP